MHCRCEKKKINNEVTAKRNPKEKGKQGVTVDLGKGESNEKKKEETRVYARLLPREAVIHKRVITSKKPREIR